MAVSRRQPLTRRCGAQDIKLHARQCSASPIILIPRSVCNYQVRSMGHTRGVVGLNRLAFTAVSPFSSSSRWKKQVILRKTILGKSTCAIKRAFTILNVVQIHSPRSESAPQPTLAATSFPEELLIKIFKYYIQDWAKLARLLEIDLRRPDARHPPTRFRHGYYGWIPAVTHVCRRWRDVALNAPVLWTNIRLMRAECVEAFLQRSQQAPLTVHSTKSLTPQEPDVVAMFKHVLECAARIQELDIPIPAPEVDQTLGRHTFPQLNQLSLRVQKWGESREALPYFLADGGDVCPHLNHLKISQYSFPVGRLLFSPSMKVLILDSCAADSTWADVFSSLRAMPQLEFLSLSGSLPQTVAPIDSTALASLEGGPVSLPRLRTLRLSASAVSCATLLKHLAIRNVAATAITVATNLSDPGAQEDTINTYFPLLADALAWRLTGGGCIGDPPTIRAVCIDGDQTMGIGMTMRAFVEEHPPTFPIPHTFSPHDIHNPASLLRLTSTQNPTSFFLHTCAIIPWADVRTLYLGSGRHFLLQMETARALFTRATGLRELHIFGGNTRLAPEIIGPLTVNTTADGDAGPPLMCPDLQVLKLHDITRDYYTPPSPNWLAALRAGLRYRKSVGRPLRELLILGPLRDMDGPRLIDSLRDCADSVLWDESAVLPQPLHPFQQDVVFLQNPAAGAGHASAPGNAPIHA